MARRREVTPLRRLLWAESIVGEWVTWRAYGTGNIERARARVGKVVSVAPNSPDMGGFRILIVMPNGQFDVHDLQAERHQSHYDTMRFITEDAEVTRLVKNFMKRRVP